MNYLEDFRVLRRVGVDI